MPEQCEVLAIRYGVWPSTRNHCFYRYPSYGEPDADVQMDFYFWLIKGAGRVVLVDVGYSAQAISTRPGRVLLTPPREALEALGTDPDSVTDIIVTHLHYDHTGNLPDFPAAHLYVQRSELDFWTSGYGAHPPQASTTETAEIEYVSAAVREGRAELLDGDTELMPGISVRHVGGHTPGQQMVRIDNAAPVILASDAVHFYEEMERDRPFEIFSDLRQMYDTFAELRRAQVETGAIVVAGHDPQVMQRFPVVAENSTGPLAVRVSV
jgi:glyoxylase-like metal-dependent hydrolase (beta-lactamase superfamily II)